MIFDHLGPAKNYGKGLDWTGTGYSVYEAAACLLRYLKRLPEPVIPYAFYDKFTSILGPTVYENDEGYDRDAFSVDVAISTLQQYITKIPPLNQQLLLYLLDIAAVFASKSNENKMTSARIVAAFQPSWLAREASVGMSVLDHVRAADTLVFMIENQDHFLIGMRGTAADDTASTTAGEATAASETGIKRTNSLDPPSTSSMDKPTASSSSV
jgi:GTPase-activating protein SAC7